MDRYLQAAIAMCDEAAAIHLSHLGRDHQIAFKSTANLVTEVDRLAEEAILTSIRRLFPDHAVVAEESGRHGRAAEFVWYVDPLDGTTNYAHGFPMFAVSIGLVHAGEPVVAAVACPALGELFTSSKGGGTWLNGRPVRVSRTVALDDALVATGFLPSVREDLRNVDELVAMLRRTQGVRRPGAAAIDLAYVACGRLDGFWEFGLSEWDVAAGSLLVSEAGGRVTKVDGTEHDLAGRSILATNGLLHDPMRDVLASTPHRYRGAVS